MNATLKKRKIDFTEGPIFFKMLMFALPLMMTSLLQQLYNTADNIVVGRFSGDDLALAAVGCTSAMTSMMVNFVIGIGVGSGVVIAQAFGAKDYKYLSRAVHTAVTFSVIGGAVFGALGFIVARPALILLGTDPLILEKAVLYFRIICLGVPGLCVYNYAASILRAVGDSRTPFFALSLSGVLNVLLNLFFVIVCKMSVAGVALATIISQYASAVAVMWALISRRDECYAVSLKKLSIDRGILVRVLKFGIPAGFQSLIIGFSNALLQAAINTFPPAAVSAKTISMNFENIAYTMINSFHHTTISVVAQNYGAGQPKRIRRAFLFSLLQAAVFGIIITQIILLFAEPLASLYIDAGNEQREAILSYSIEFMTITLQYYFICGLMESFSGTLRGYGNSFVPMICSILGMCGTRILWVEFVFPLELFNNATGLYAVYPVSWTVTMILNATALGIYLLYKRRADRIKLKSIPH